MSASAAILIIGFMLAGDAIVFVFVLEGISRKLKRIADALERTDGK